MNTEIFKHLSKNLPSEIVAEIDSMVLRERFKNDIEQYRNNYEQVLDDIFFYDRIGVCLHTPKDREFITLLRQGVDQNEAIDIVDSHKYIDRYN